MSKTDYFGFTVLIIGAGTGWFINGYDGGLISGACGTSFILVIIGKIAFIKSSKRIDKSIKDILINNED